MSIYSGFATRHLQETYDRHVCDILFVLQKRLLKFYQNADTDEDKFWGVFSQLYYQIIQLQKSKYLEPKSSQFIHQIFEYLKTKKQQRLQDPQEDLKHFQRSFAIKTKKQQNHKKKEPQINNFIQRSSFSFGKIKRQLDHANTVNVLFQSNHEIAELKYNSFDLKLRVKVPNPEQKISVQQKRMYSSKETRNEKSFHQQINGQTNEIKQKLAGGSAKQVVKQYLQKTNKNYLRGYRKRKIKQQHHKAETKPLNCKQQAQ